MIPKLPRFPLLLAICVAATGIAAQARDVPAGDPFESLLYPPELVMRNQASIGLSTEQRTALITEITEAQADLVPFQVEMAEFGEILARRLAEPEIDEEAALAAARRIVELESAIKQRHLRLAIRIKNLLTEEQKQRLDRLR